MLREERRDVKNEMPKRKCFLEARCNFFKEKNNNNTEKAKITMKEP